MKREINASLGAWRGMTVQAAVKAARSASEPLVGKISTRHAQICPQNRGKLTVDDAQHLVLCNPEVQFRLHANVQKEGWSSTIDASTYGDHEPYFLGLQSISESLHAPAYTWHAGARRHASLEAVFARTRNLEDAWGIPVGIEGMYPTADDRYLLSTWEEYRVMLDSGVNYALDMSHINILAHRSGRRDDALVQDLLACPNCIEVHLSGNAGDADTHGQLAAEPWWWNLLDAANQDAVFFTEGGQTRPTYF